MQHAIGVTVDTAGFAIGAVHDAVPQLTAAPVAATVGALVLLLLIATTNELLPAEPEPEPAAEGCGESALPPHAQPRPTTNPNPSSKTRIAM
jgi:hypothetical protein